MIDFIFGISDAHTWHTINLQQHPHHYPSLLRSLGPHAISKCQENFGAGVYFHPFTTVNGTLITYGVVNLESLRRDLVSWNTLYLAGRMQKPVIVLQDNAAIRDAGRANLVSALRTALLLLPGRFTERQLYATLAGLSYMGEDGGGVSRSWRYAMEKRRKAALGRSRD
ncbi:mitochondrial matrix Mmp37 [Aspergillus arachidicola]|uniref:Phosphatidate cytidylyltransferase, mitochondrial n=1 Tax=Aspergillus arachidicola TaxID=656916 RepID=A0A5N6Y0I2_9EURO|nr:mitochondrial matrix Mmp37 [Aspergillus arachidicola]